MEERLQKILSRAGFGSRRECEEFIAAQRVTVNGETAILGMKVDPDRDQIRVDGITINFQEPEKIYVAVNKPRFVLSDRADNDARQTVYQLVPNSETLFVVGRLDFESEGLVLMTNDGDLANKLTHPRFEKEKEYKVLVAKRPDTRQLSAWQRGVILEDGEKTAPANVSIARTQGDGAWLRVIMHEGRKREIREICRAIGLPIVKLIRVRIGTLLLGKLEPREWRWLKPQEVKELKDLVAKKTPPLKPKPASARRPAPRRSSSEKTAASSRFEDRRNERFSPNPDRNEARPSRAPYRAGSKPYPRREPFDRSEPNERGGEFRERSGRNEARSSRAPYRAGSKPYPRREPFDRSKPNERGGEFHERSGKENRSSEKRSSGKRGGRF